MSIISRFYDFASDELKPPYRATLNGVTTKVSTALEELADFSASPTEVIARVNNDSVLTKEQNETTHLVGNGGYASIQAAFDALPAEGGEIKIQSLRHSETGIVLGDKPAIIRGVAGNYAADADGYGTIIDTSGGDGILIDHEGIRLQDIVIDGDHSQYDAATPANSSFDSYYGVKIGTGATLSTVLDSVSIMYKGAGIVYGDSLLNSKFDISAYRCDVGHHVNVPDGYVNQNVWERLSATYCISEGLIIEGSGGADGSFEGNVIEQWRIEKCGLGGGDALTVTNQQFLGNEFRGYGIEEGSGSKSVNIAPVEGGNNKIDVRVGPNPNQGDITALSLSDFRELNFGDVCPSYRDGEGVLAPDAINVQIAIDFANDHGASTIILQEGSHSVIEPHAGQTIKGESKADVTVTSGTVTVDGATNTPSNVTLRDFKVETTSGSDQAVYFPSGCDGLEIDNVRHLGSGRAAFRAGGNQVRIVNSRADGGVTGSDAPIRVRGDNSLVDNCIVESVNGGISDEGSNNTIGDYVTI